MTRANWIRVGIIAIAALVVTTVVWADQSYFTPNRPNVGLKEIYNRDMYFSGVDSGPVQLPRPVGSAAASYGNAKAGPVASPLDSADVNGALGAARGGGSMYSEKQQADQEIGRLIRRLD